VLHYGARRRRNSLPVNAEINIVNLVDVAFVLLIIFMITAPILQGGIEVELPRTQASPITSSESIIVSVAANGDLFIDKAQIGSLAELETALRAVLGDNPADRDVMLKADRSVTHGRVMEVMGIMNEIGVPLAIAAEPLPRGRR
jgi:biopolymer transport protein TolR